MVGGKDSLTRVVGLATDGTTPAAASDFSVEFGGLFATIPAGSFKKSGDRFTFKGDVNGITSVTLDYAREQITVQAKNADLGPFAAGGNATTIGVQLGSDGRAVTVRTVRSGTSLRYCDGPSPCLRAVSAPSGARLQDRERLCHLAAVKPAD